MDRVRAYLVCILSAESRDVNFQSVVFEGTLILDHTGEDEASLLSLEIAEAEYEAHLGRAYHLLDSTAELLAEECRWQDSLANIDHLTTEERAQALGLRLVLA